MITESTQLLSVRLTMAPLLRLLGALTFSSITYLAFGQLYNQSFNVINQGFDNCTTCGLYNSPGYPAGNSWRLISGPDLSGDYFKTRDIGGGNIVLEAKDLDGEFCFRTRAISIAGQSNTGFSVSLSSSGTFETDDYINVSYSVNGGSSYTKLTDWQGLGDIDHTLIGGFGGAQTVEACNLTGSSMVVRVCMDNDANPELYRIHQVSVDTTFSCILNPCTDCAIVPTGGSGICAYPGIGNNPELLACDQFKIAFVIDESGSIVSANAQDSVERGTLAFLQNLVCPNVEVAVIEFGTTANTITDYVPNDGALQSNMMGYFNGTAFNGYTQNTTNNSLLTNWHDAMYEIQQLSSIPDLILFFTDGNPTVYGIGNGIECGNTSEIRGPELYNSMAISNQLKALSSHIFMLGVGTVNATNLSRMSGTTQYDMSNTSHSIANTDYAIENFTTLAQCLAMFGSQLCPASSCVASTACPSQNNGSITTTTTGSFGSGTTFTYAFDGPGIDGTPDIIVTNSMNPYTQSGLGVGTYSVEVLVNIDATCSKPTLPCIVDITSVLCSVSNEMPSTCDGSANGSFDLNVSGGTPSYDYVISNGIDPNITGNLAMDGSVSIQNLNPGVYDITVTETGSSACVSICQATIIDAMNGPMLMCSDGHISCFGDTDGTVSVNASGGAGGYSYVWNSIPTQTTSTAAGLPVGSYSVTVTDAIGCKETCLANVTGPSAALSTSCSSNHPNNRLDCFGDADGRVNANPSGGTPGYTYSWSNANTTMFITGLTAGSYSVTVTDIEGCTSTCSQTLLNPPLLTCAISNFSNPSCHPANGGSGTNGLISATATGGTGAYSFSLGSITNTTGTFSGLAAGTYNLTVTDTKNCTSTCTQNLTNPPMLSCSITSFVNPSCNPGNGGNSANGAINVMGTGGTGTYFFTDGMTTNTTGVFTGLPAGVYNFTVTDANNCTSTCTQTLTNPPVLSCSISNFVNPSCHPGNGGNDMNGSITLSGSGGTGAYSFTNGMTTNTTGAFTGLAAGTYNFTITDANNCISICSQTLVNPTMLSCAISNFTNPSCNPGNGGSSMDGSITISGTGGIGAYTFSNGTTTNTTGSFTGLTAGVYNFTITDVNNCTTTCTQTLTNPTVLSGSISSFTHPACNPGNGGNNMNGSITITATGGTGAYTFTDGSTTNTTGSFAGLMAGSYVITITDANNCTTTCSQTLTAPPLLSCSISNFTNPSCHPANGGNTINGSITLIGSGGTGGYSFTDGTTINTTGTFTGLAAGIYNFTITDASNCTSMCSQILTNPPALSCNITNSINPSCNPANGGSGSDGSITLSASGGAGDYVFSNGASTNTTGSFTGLSSGTFIFTVTDVNNCTSTCTRTLTNPPLLSCSITNFINPSCNPGNSGNSADGSITITGTGGTGTYVFTNGATTNTTGSFTGLSAGTYHFTITDVNSCTSMCMQTLTDPPLLSCSIVGFTNPTCNPGNGGNSSNGSITISGSGGTGSYSFSNGITTNTTGVFTGLSSGAYNLTVTDANNCMSTCSRTLVDPPLLSCSIVSVIDPTCHPGNGAGSSNGAITISGSGGTGGYTFTNGPTTNTTGLFTGLASGTYTLTVTDANNCTSTCMTSLEGPPFLSCSISNFANPSCHPGNFGSNTDGFITVTASGGTAPYSFTNGTTTNSTGVFVGLSAGDYVFTIRDANNCTSSCMLTLSYPPAISCDIIGSDVICNTIGTGAADASVSGGTGSYSYSWSNGGTTQDITGLSSGTYNLTVSDANSCRTTCSVAVGGLRCSTSQTECGANALRGAVSSVSGGMPPYSYLWSTGETTQSIEGLIPGTYTLIVTDAQDCETECEVIVNRCTSCEENCSTAFARLNGFEQCFDQFGYTQWGWTNGLLGQGNYTFDLHSEALLCDLNNGTLVGQLTLNYTNDLVVATYTLTGNYYMTLTSFYVGCQTIPVVDGTQTVSPSQYPYQVLQNNTTTYTFTIDVTHLPCEGIYVIAHAEICLPSDFACDISSTSVDCSGGSTGMATASVTGGISPYNYLWSTGETIISINGLSEGVYSLTVTDETSCTTTCDVVITYPPISVQQIGPFCQNDAPYDLRTLITDPNLMGSWGGPGVSEEIFYPSSLPVGIHDILYVDQVSCVSAMVSIFVDTICCPPDYAASNGRKLIGIQEDIVHYETDGILDSEQVIEANTIYDSKLQIMLQPEFEVILGHEFSAIIDGCP